MFNFVVIYIVFVRWLFVLYVKIDISNFMCGWISEIKVFLIWGVFFLIVEGLLSCWCYDVKKIFLMVKNYFFVYKSFIKIKNKFVVIDNKRFFELIK